MEEQEAVALDDLPKVKPEGALSEEDAKYFEFYRKVQDDLRMGIIRPYPNADTALASSAIPKKIWLNGKEIEVYGTSETLSDLFDQLRSAGVTVGAPQPIAPDDLLTRDMKGELELAIAEETMRKQIKLAAHEHEFTYLLNNNHTALRGCKCGLAFVGLMAGTVQDLQWHQIHEVEE